MIDFNILQYQFLLQKRKNFYNGRKNMYEYKFSDDETKEINQKTKTIDELFKKFDDIDGKYTFKEEQTVSNNGLNLERKEFEMPDEDTIKKQAENSLAEYKDSSVKKIENDYIENKEILEQNLSQAKTNKENQQSSLKQAYEQVKTNASNDAIKRGLARSSIIVNKLAEYDGAMLTEFAQIEKDYTDAFTKLNNQKSQLEIQRQNALDGFDIAYAVKLTEKINQINSDLEEKQNKVIEYNNKIEQLEKEYLQNQEKITDDKNEAIRDDNAKLLEYYTKNGQAYIDKLKQEEKYNLALEYLNTLSKQDAINTLNNNTKFKDNFPTYYNKLLSAVYNRVN